MTPQECAEAVFKEIRTFYTRGGSARSANKSYDLAHTPKERQNKADFRNIESDLAYAILAADRAANTAMTVCARGEIHHNKNIAAMNCGELAELACFYAYRTTNIADWIREAWLAPDPNAAAQGDHFWCVIGHPHLLDQIAGTVVRDLAALDFKPEHAPWFVDGWLNLCCRCTDYPAAVSAKFAKWLKAGKRIRWQGQWNEPGGAYEQVFLSSRVALAPIH